MRSMNQAPTAKPVIPTPHVVTRVVNVAILLGEQRELVIRHGDERYRLSLTRNGKLILTK